VSAKPPSRVAFGKAVREVRHERGWTLEVLAGEAGLHWTYIGGIERGERNPSWENVGKLAAALGVKVSELASRAEDVS
jgi:transcriptional regulator with XRE-family HTH domain